VGTIFGAGVPIGFDIAPRVHRTAGCCMCGGTDGGAVEGLIGGVLEGLVVSGRDLASATAIGCVDSARHGEAGGNDCIAPTRASGGSSADGMGTGR